MQMVTLVLPGYSAHNKTWAEETAGNIHVEGQIRPIFWDHWQNPDKVFDPSEKAKLLVGVSAKNTINIIAKSIGTLVASYVIERDPAAIRKLIFCGIPLNDLSEEDTEEIRKALRDFPADKVLCIQNDEDPHGSFEQAKNFYGLINSEIKVISESRSDHEYPKYEEFNSFLNS